MPYNEKTTNLADDLKGTAKDQLKQAYRESVGQDIREGSSVYQLFIGRIADFLAPVIDFIWRILGALNLNLSTTYDTFIDVLASVFLVTRNEGGKATGSVYMEFTSSDSVEIPTGTIFYTGKGLQFEVVRTQVIVPSQFSSYRGRFRTPPIYLRAVEPGEKYTIGSGEISGTLSSFTGLYSIYNTSPFSSGADRETNDQLLARIKDSVSSRTLSNHPGIKYVLKTTFPSISEIEIVGAGDPEMTRDKVYATTSVSGIPHEAVDFSRKVYGSISEARSKAYTTFLDTKEPVVNVDINGIADVDGFNTELSQENYNRIGGKDANLVTVGSDVILDELWTPGAATSDVSPWFCAETNDERFRRWADWVRVDGGYLTIGAAATVTNARTMHGVVQRVLDSVAAFTKTYLSKTDMAPLKTQLDSVVREYGPQMPAPSDVIPVGGRGSVENLVPKFRTLGSFLNSFIQNELAGDSEFGEDVTRTNISPVVQIPLSQQGGIVVSGSFNIVDDDSSRIRPLFVTNFRANNLNPKAHDGYGFAVYPTKEASQPNVLLTDNNSLADDYFIGGSSFDAESFSENYLKGVELQIDLNTEYRYEMIYGVPASGERNAVTLEVRIWASSGSRPASPTISYGAYVPMNRRAESVAGDVQNIEPTDFGFGIMETDGFTWKLGPVRVLQGSTVYSQILYMMDATAFESDDVQLYVGHRGYGSDSGVKTFGSEVKIIDFNTPASPVWELVEANATGAVNFTKKVFDVDRYSDADNYIFILVTSTYPYDGLNDINSVVESDYIQISKSFEGYHVGSKIDVYIKPKSSIYTPESESFVDIVSGSGSIQISTSNGFINPVTRIKSVEILDATLNPTGTFLAEFDDCRLLSVDAEEDLSTRENKILLLTNYAQIFNLRISYYYVAGVDAMQAYVDGESARGSRSDILVRLPRFKYIDISFSASYNGSDFTDAIKAYVYNASTRIRAYDLIALAAEYGVSSANLASIVISYFQYDADGNKTEGTSNDEVTKTRTEVFIPNSITITV